MLPKKPKDTFESEVMFIARLGLPLEELEERMARLREKYGVPPAETVQGTMNIIEPPDKMV